MKRAFALCLIAGAIAGSAFAQDATIELLSSDLVEGKLYLRIGRNDSRLEYQLDGSSPADFHSLSSTKPLNVLSKGSINVWVGEFNPFLQSFEAELGSFDDETFKGFGEFVEALSSYGTAVNLIESKAQTAASEAVSGAASAGGGVSLAFGSSLDVKAYINDLVTTIASGSGSGAAKPLDTLSKYRSIKEARTSLPKETAAMNDSEVALTVLSAQLALRSRSYPSSSGGPPIENASPLVQAGLDPVAILETHAPSASQLEALVLVVRDVPQKGGADPLKIGPVTRAWLGLALSDAVCIELDDLIDLASALKGAELEIPNDLKSSKELKDVLKKAIKKGDEGYSGLFGDDDSAYNLLTSVKSKLTKQAADSEATVKRFTELRSQVDWRPAAQCGVRRAASLALLGVFSQESERLTEAEKTLAASVESLLKALKIYNDHTKWAGTAYLAAQDVSPSEEKGRTVKVTAAKRTVSVADDGITLSTKKGSAGTVRFRKFYSLVPEYAFGAVLNQLEAPKYKVGTETDAEDVEKTVVMADGFETEEVRPAALLNFLCRCGGLNLAHPGFQIGVTTGEDRPAVLVGGVLRFTRPKHLSISFGAMYTQFKDLDKLSVGDEVEDEEALKEDLKFKGETDFFVAFQVSFKLGKK